MGQVVRIACHYGRLLLDRGDHHYRVHHIGGARCSADDARGSAGSLVVGNDVATFESAGDLMLRSTPPGLGKNDNRHYRTDVSSSQFVVQGEEVGVASLGGQQGAGVINDGAH
ncbi:MAG: hypothetical protein QOG10_4869 [Kribbellaceae bacterium]|nr:hypothetical protein [Kribbellaceae bacterium]